MGVFFVAGGGGVFGVVVVEVYGDAEGLFRACCLRCCGDGVLGRVVSDGSACVAADWCLGSGGLDVLGLGSVFDGVIVVSGLGFCFGHGLVLFLLRRVDLDLEVIEPVLRRLLGP